MEASGDVNLLEADKYNYSKILNGLVLAVSVCNIIASPCILLLYFDWCFVIIAVMHCTRRQLRTYCHMMHGDTLFTSGNGTGIHYSLGNNVWVIRNSRGYGIHSDNELGNRSCCVIIQLSSLKFRSLHAVVMYALIPDGTIDKQFCYRCTKRPKLHLVKTYKYRHSC